MSRQISTQSNISLPDMSMQIMNVRVTEEHSLYHICDVLLRRLGHSAALKPYIALAKSTSAGLCEKQAFLINQNNNNISANMSHSLTSLNTSRNSSTVSNGTPTSNSSVARHFFENTNSGNSNFSHMARSSSSSVESHSPAINDSPSAARFSSTSVNSTASSHNGKNDLLTFFIGILPQHVECDPVTQLSKLFQLGAPLCIIFNAVKPQYALPVISSDDVKICKKSIYDFICACKVHLAFNDEELFTISDVFSRSTDHLMKIIEVISILLDAIPKIFPPVAINVSTLHSASSSTLSSPVSKRNSPMYEFGQPPQQTPHATFQRNKSAGGVPNSANPYSAFPLSTTASFTPQSATSSTSSTYSTKDERYRVFREFLETERKYVYDLEILQDFNYQLLDQNIINLDESFMCFPNLQEIIEFQRKFLISLESNNNINFNDQRVGSIFVHSNNFFKLYEPWSIGQTAAIEYISTLPVFQTQSSNLIIKNKLELQAFLLKPVQRLCKYPLLMKELIQATPADCVNFKELENGLQISKNVAKSINENQRKTENHQIVKLLNTRVNSWKGYNISKFGDLFFSNSIIISNGSANSNIETGIGINNKENNQANKQFDAYLFEKIIVLFSILPDPNDKRSTSVSSANSSFNGHDSSTKNSLMKTASSTLNLKKNKTASAQLAASQTIRESSATAKLDLRGRIMVPTINKLSSVADHSLLIQWETSKEQGNFTFKFKNDETRDNWFTCLNNLVKQFALLESPSNGSATTSPNSTSSSSIQINKMRSLSLSSSMSSGSTPAENTSKLTNSMISSASNTSTSPQNNNNNNAATTKRNSNRSSGTNLRLSSSSNQYLQRHQHYNSVASLNSLQNITENTSHSSLTSVSRQTTSYNAFESEYRSISENYKHSIPDNQLLCRVQFQSDFYTVLITADSDFSQVFNSIQRKLTHMGDMQKIKYQDEDGDYVVIQSDEDWSMVKEWLAESNESILNLIAYN